MDISSINNLKQNYEYFRTLVKGAKSLEIPLKIIALPSLRGAPNKTLSTLAQLL